MVEHLMLAPRAAPVFGPIIAGIARATIDRLFLELVQRLMFWPASIPDQWKDDFPYDQVLEPSATVANGEDMAAILPGAIAGLLDLSRITVPAHIITGTRDKIVEDERQGKLVGRLLSNARVTEVDDVGHMLHIIRPEIVVEAVREALAAV